MINLTMGFFSDPAAKQVPADYLPEAAPAVGAPRDARRRRSAEERKQRRQQKDLKRRESDSFIPDEAQPQPRMRRASSVVSIRDIASSAAGSDSRRGSSSRSSFTMEGSLNLSFTHDFSKSHQDSSMSMQDHLESLESFVLHVKNADKKQQEKILKRASGCDLLRHL